MLHKIVIAATIVATVVAQPFAIAATGTPAQ
jgi:hypothetical protein